MQLRGAPRASRASARRLTATPAAPAQRLAQRRLAPCAALPVEVDTVTAAYWVLGASGVSFLATFGVAPLFRSSFKEDVDWQTVYRGLVAGGGVPGVTPAAAYAKRKSAALVDVRLAMKHAQGHPEGSMSVPLYVPIQGWGPAQMIRRLGFAFFGIYGTQLNADFAAQAAAAIPKGREVILVCENGGSLQNKAGTVYGFQSRSLKAAYYLRKAGFSKVSYVQGGVAQWGSDGLPLATAGGEEDDDGSGSGADEPAATDGGLWRPAFLGRRR